jgi:protocatechuate 3,4-dioxygenase beta subunit
VSRSAVLVLLASVLFVVLGGLLWLTMSDTDSSQASTALSEAPATKAPKASDVALEAPEDQARDTDDVASSERTAIARAESAPAPAATPADTQRGAAELTGSVRSSAGAPVVGARVVAFAGDMGIDFGLPLDAEGNDFPGRRRIEAKTDSEGRFKLVGVSSGRQRVAVRAPKFAPYDANDVVVPAGANHDLGVIVLDLGGVLTGRVVNRRGAPIAGAHLRQVLETTGNARIVLAGSLKPSVELTQSGADGSFSIDTLPTGPFNLRVWHDDHPDQTASGTVALPGQVLAPLTITLDDGASIAGRVSGAPAAALSELSVRATPRSEGAALDFEFDFDFDTSAAQGGEGRSAKLAADGSFEVRGLREERDYTLGLRRGGGPGAFEFGQRLSTRVEARAGARGVEIAYRPESSLVCQVIDARTRQPIEELRVSAGIGFPMPVAAPAGAGRNRFAEGRVRAGNLRPRPSNDRATLKIEAVGYRPWSREDLVLREGESLDLGVVELQPTPVVRVTVLDDATGQPLEGARVTLRKTREESPRDRFSRAIAVRAGAASGDDAEPEFAFDGEDSRSERTDERGEARLTSFEGQRCELAVSHGKFAPHAGEPFVAGLEGDEKTVRLRLGGSARVTLLSAAGVPLAGGRVERRAGGASEPVVFGPGGTNSAVTDATGVAKFERLAAGVHEFRPAPTDGGMIGGGGAVVMISGMEDADDKWSSVEVREGEEVELTLHAPLKVLVSGVVREGGEPLAGATVRLAPKRAEDEPRMPRLPFGGGPTARTDARGMYQLSGVEPGEYTLSVSHPSRAMETELELRVAERDTRQDVALAIATIEGRVVGAEGEPLSGVRVSAERERGANQPRAVVGMVFAGDNGGVGMIGGEDGAENVFTDADGRYSLRGVAIEVPLVVRAELKGLQPARSEAFEVRENESKRGVDLKLAKAGEIEVTAFKADGSPAQMVIVTATPEGDLAATAERKTGFIPEGGKTTLDGLAPGSWKVSVRAVGGVQSAGPSSSPPIEQVVVVKPGVASPVRFDFP